MKSHGKLAGRTGMSRTPRRLKPALQVGSLVALIGLQLLGFQAQALAASSAPSSNDDYNFSWLDPDKKIYVLQNRRYQKAQRVHLSAMAGLGLSSPYRNTMGIDARLGYYFTEVWGMEAFYGGFSNAENSTYEQLKLAAANTLPQVREIRQQFGALLHYAPWYAKINVFNKILYFDWYFSLGAGSLTTALDTRTRSSAPAAYLDESFTAYYVGTGHQYHLNENWFARLDFMGTYYQAPLLGQTGETTWFSNYTFAIGIGFRP